jgi:hypothetical protein
MRPCTPGEDISCMADCQQEICAIPGPGIGKPTWNTGKCIEVIVILGPNGKITTRICECDQTKNFLGKMGDCGPAMYGPLYKAVQDKCLKDASGKDGIKVCEEGMGKKELAKLAKRFLECAEARLQLMDTCFRGGDQAHRYWQLGVVANNLKCLVLLAKKNVP